MTTPLTRSLPGDVAQTSPGGSASSPWAAVRDEVLAAFLRYEAALAANDVATMTELFGDAEDIVRFGVVDSQLGATEIAAWRTASGPLPPDRRLSDTRVQVLTPDAAVVTTRFAYGDAPATGRQTQVWLRTPGGWRVVSAHVSDVVEN